jgi:YHS domain-containing protein
MKRRKIMMACIALTIGLGLSAAMAAENKEIPKKQTTCPVMGGKIDKSQYVDVKGKRIYVCCAGCVAKIKADPDKYIKELEDQGIVLDETPKTDSKKTGH